PQPAQKMARKIRTETLSSQRAEKNSSLEWRAIVAVGAAKIKSQRMAQPNPVNPRSMEWGLFGLHYVVHSISWYI
ncbi:hypothetical protein SARC_18273, partial [Sphaeroforma arctica JP610]